MSDFSVTFTTVVESLSRNEDSYLTVFPEHTFASLLSIQSSLYESES